jgi:hypothetical protein
MRVDAVALVDLLEADERCRADVIGKLSSGLV